MFPGIINCTSMDYFHDWPRDALIDVANRFLINMELPQEEIRENIAQHMATVHLSIDEANKEFLAQERRHNYTTPTSYLELIKFYLSLQGKETNKITEQINRLEVGLTTMKSTTDQVASLQEALEVKMKDVEIEKTKTDALIEQVGIESTAADKDAELAAI